MSVKTFKKRCCYCKTWQARNNSSNVAAILQPECYPEDPDQHFFYHNTCYCREKHIRPKLFPKPKNCIVIDSNLCDTENRLKGYTCPTNSTFLPPKDNYLKDCDRIASIYKRHDIESSENENVFFPEDRHLEHASNGHKYGSYFDNLPKVTTTDANYYDDTQRKKSRTGNGNIEDWSNFSYDDISKRRESENYHIEDGFDENHETWKTIDETDVDNVDNQIFFSKNPPTNSGEEAPFLDTAYSKSEDEIEKGSNRRLRQISDFRNDHYFKTHSTEDLIKTIPEHICVHRFGLDNRLLPEALHADGYGVSRCIICDRPMESPQLNKIDTRYDTKRENIFPKFYKYGLAPKKIYMGNDANVQIEMKLDCDKMRYKMMDVGKGPKYADTYALRYQKGVV